MVTCLFLISPSVFANERIPKKPKELRNDPGLSLEIKLDKKSYRVGETIKVQCIFKNVGESTINIRDILFLDLTFIVIDKESSEKKELGIRTLPNDVWRAQNIIKIVPGDLYADERVINETFYKMPQKAGYYELYVIYFNVSNKYKKIKLWTGKLKSNLVGFEIMKEN